MLDEKGIAFTYRDYVKDPLGAAELRTLFDKLTIPVGRMLRTREAAYKELGLTGDEPDDVLIGHIVAHPRLLNRPIGVSLTAAVFGRPIEALLTL